MPAPALKALFVDTLAHGAGFRGFRDMFYGRDVYSLVPPDLKVLQA